MSKDIRKEKVRCQIEEKDISAFVIAKTKEGYKLQPTKYIREVYRLKSADKRTIYSITKKLFLGEECFFVTRIKKQPKVALEQR